MASAAAIDGLEASISQANSSMDWMWLLLGGALVFFMHSGFALLVRSAPDVACRSAFIVAGESLRRPDRCGGCGVQEVGSVSVRNTQVSIRAPNFHPNVLSDARILLMVGLG